MFTNVSRTLAVGAAMAGARALAVAQLMKSYGIRSFRDGLQKRIFEAAARGHSTRYSKRYNPHGKREMRRRFLQDSQQHQFNSHKPGSVQPRHIFGAA
jgi:hypothetical protein